MERYGLIGHPLGHSFSKAYFTEKFKREHIEAQYVSFDLTDLNQLGELLKQHPDLRGFNVTIPYKEAILPYLDALDPVAQEVGAVNTVKVLRDGKLIGHNTDVIGISSTLLAPHSSLLVPLSSLILGTGGASKAVQYVLRKNNIPYKTVSRSKGRGSLSYQDLTPEIIQSHLLIINATPVGMAPHCDGAPSLPYEALTPDHLLFDLIYNPEETLFLRHGRQHGAKTINGLTMLHAQAEASWNIWNRTPSGCHVGS